jgi:subtilase family serine protease
MGLSPLTNANFQVVFPDGPPKTALTDPQLLDGWAVETSLDVEWAHALAPDAKIVLLVAPSQDDDELVFALSYAALHKLGNVISNSYGASEVATGSVVARNYNSTIKKAAAEGIAVNFASGDSGDNGVGSPLGAAGVPADSPFATAVGGTSIGVPSDQGPVETAWGETVTSLGTSTQPSYPLLPNFLQGSGGGESVYLAKPGFQKQLPGLGRQTPDVSALADPLTGAIIVWNAQASVIGGTSLATPIFSALWTLANQAAGQSLGQAAPILAKMTSNALQDVLPIVASAKNTSGTIALNGGAPMSENPADFLGLTSTQPEGFIGTISETVSRTSFFRPAYADLGFGTDSSLTATVGWDSATGWGVPKGLPFIKEAIKHAKPNS